ncbi:MAG: hypothetical protein QGF97_03225 [Alphaproteobacteria bacterium]|nr:hypothetical protein [Alphaproteobacteria bacterium]MDP7164272.1 hypothetical protein [Alphaproteobacteria bacterium]
MDAETTETTETINFAAAREAIKAYSLKRGAVAVGIADADLVERIAPQGFGPKALLPGARSVISIGVTGCTRGTWKSNAKVMTFIGNSVGPIYRASFGLSFFIEKTFAYPSIFVPPHVDPEYGARVPIQSLKLHAELAGIGARSMAGDILLHPEYGLLYYGSVITEMPLPTDTPMAANPCPAPACVEMYKRQARTPCQKFCPVDCLSGSIADGGEIDEMVCDMARCAEMCQQYENMPNIISDAITAEAELDREEALYGAESQAFFYKVTSAVGATHAQCFECMRVCPVVTAAPQADPIRMGEAARGA